MKKMLKKQKRNSLQKTLRDSIKYLKKEEWQALKESIDNFRDKIIINLLYSSGVRVAELCLMKIEEIDFDNGFIRIPKENTKTKQSRTVRMGKETLSDLKALLRLAQVYYAKSGDLERETILRDFCVYTKRRFAL